MSESTANYGTLVYIANAIQHVSLRPSLYTELDGQLHDCLTAGELAYIGNNITRVIPPLSTFHERKEDTAYRAACLSETIPLADKLLDPYLASIVAIYERETNRDGEYPSPSLADCCVAFEAGLHAARDIVRLSCAVPARTV